MKFWGKKHKETIKNEQSQNLGGVSNQWNDVRKRGGGVTLNVSMCVQRGRGRGSENWH